MLALLVAAYIFAPDAHAQSTAPQPTARQLQDRLAGISPAAPTATPAPSAGTEIFRGSGSFLVKHRRRAAQADEPADITLNFVNTDIKDVAKAILGDYLKLNYEIAGDVQGSITIQTSQPLTRSQVLPVLEQVLRLNNLALVETVSVYKVVPLASAVHQAGPVRLGSRAGYGIEVVPVRYVAAAEMEKLLEPLAPSQGIVHVDTTRNVLIIEGTEDERQTLMDDVRLFDADWLSGMSFALFTPGYTDAQELSRELTNVMAGLSGSGVGLVRLVPIDRLNAILAISPQPAYLEQLRNWITRLDRPGQGTDRRIFVYHVQNGRAVDLAATLSKTLFGGNDLAHSASPPPPTGPPAGSPTNGAAPNSTSVPGSAAQEGQGVAVGQMRNVSITADETNNALVVLATPQEFATIKTALSELDSSPLQVFLEAAIAEITLGDNLKFGVQYALQDPHNQIVLTNSATPVIKSQTPGLSYIFTNGSSIQVILNEISTETHVEVVSSPKLLVLNNQTATLQVGDRVPIATEQAVSTITTGAPVVNSIQYQDTGVILRVTPRVNRGGLVMMDISQEVSSVIPTTSSGIDSPTIEQRKINSSVAITDGETVALGGLIQDRTNKSKSGIPLIEDIPVLGNLFATTTRDAGKTELMVLITPHVVDNVEKARAITDELRHKLPSVQPLFERG